MDDLVQTIRDVLAAHAYIEPISDGMGRNAAKCLCHEWAYSTNHEAKAEDSHREHLAAVVEEQVRGREAVAWDNGIDTAGQYAEQPWVVDEECKPLNPYRRDA